MRDAWSLRLLPPLHGGSCRCGPWRFETGLWSAHHANVTGGTGVMREAAVFAALA